MPYAEYLAMGETKHHEYYDGAVTVSPPSRQHVRVAGRLFRALDDACPAGHEVLAEWGWAVGRQEDYEPDILVARTDAPGADPLRASPLLVLEVTSRSTRHQDFGRKVDAYARGGAPWYWVVDAAEHELTVMRLVGSRYEAEVLTAGRHQLVEPFPVMLDLVQLFG